MRGEAMRRKWRKDEKCGNWKRSEAIAAAASGEGDGEKTEVIELGVIERPNNEVWSSYEAWWFHWFCTLHKANRTKACVSWSAFLSLFFFLQFGFFVFAILFFGFILRWRGLIWALLAEPNTVDHEEARPWCQTKKADSHLFFCDRKESDGFRNSIADFINHIFFFTKIYWDMWMLLII